jgi:hypothetical protein
MNIGLLITTCKHYFSNIPNLIKDIEECNFPKENILIVSGQEDSESTYYYNDVKVATVTYTGLHLTGVIYLNENRELFNNINYWILLPDTIQLKKLFYINIMKYYDKYIKDNEIYSLPFINTNVRRATMDMGIINIKHIYNMVDYLNKIKKKQPYSINDILELKKQLIYDENIILGLPATCPSTSTKFKYINSVYPIPDKFITNNAYEITEQKCNINNKLCNIIYFVNLDMFKTQRNFDGPDAKLIMDL